MTFEHNSVRKNLFLSACFCWDSGVSLGEMDQKFLFGGLIGLEILIWTLYFVIPKYSDCMQYYTMLLEQFDHILPKDLLLLHDWTRTKFMFAWSRDWTTLLPLRKFSSNLHFQLC